MRPMAFRRSKRMVCMVWIPLEGAPRQSSAVRGRTGSANHWEQQVRGVLSVMVDAVRHGLASAHVIRDVFDVGHGAGAGGDVHGGDLETEPMTRLEPIGGRQDL